MHLIENTGNNWIIRKRSNLFWESLCSFSALILNLLIYFVGYLDIITTILVFIIASIVPILRI